MKYKYKPTGAIVTIPDGFNIKDKTMFEEVKAAPKTRKTTSKAAPKTRKAAPKATTSASKAKETKEE